MSLTLTFLTVNNVQCPFCGVGEDKPLGGDAIAVHTDLIEVLEGFLIDCTNCQHDYKLISASVLNLTITNHQVLPLGLFQEMVEDWGLNEEAELTEVEVIAGVINKIFGTPNQLHSEKLPPFNEGSTI